MYRMIEFKRNARESSRKPFNPLNKKTRNQMSPTPKNDEGMQLNEYAMEKWCHVHNSHHFKKYCMEFINMYNATFAPPT